MTIYDLKPQFQNLLRPITKKLSASGVTPNTITTAAIILSALGGTCVFFAQSNINLLWIVPIVLFVRMALNAIDGMLAREHNMQSNLGAMLNEIGDVVSDIFLYVPFAYLSPLLPELVLSLVFLSTIIEMIGVVSVQIGASRRYDGPFGKSDRAFLFGIIAVVLLIDSAFSTWLNFLLAGCIALSIWTIRNRAANALLEAKGK